MRLTLHPRGSGVRISATYRLLVRFQICESVTYTFRIDCRFWGRRIKLHYLIMLLQAWAIKNNNENNIQECYKVWIIWFSSQYVHSSCFSFCNKYYHSVMADFFPRAAIWTDWHGCSLRAWVWIGSQRWKNKMSRFVEWRPA